MSKIRLRFCDLLRPSRLQLVTRLCRHWAFTSTMTFTANSLRELAQDGRCPQDRNLVITHPGAPGVREVSKIFDHTKAMSNLIEARSQGSVGHADEPSTLQLDQRKAQHTTIVASVKMELSLCPHPFKSTVNRSPTELWPREGGAVTLCFDHSS